MPSATRAWLITLLGWLWRELRFLRVVVCEPTFAASLLIGLILGTLAYQIPFTTTLHIGGDSRSHRREDDAPFLRGFNGSEPEVKGVDWWTLAPGYGYRWASTDAIVELPGVGGSRWLLTVTASSGRADGTPTTSAWQSEAQQIDTTIAPDPHVYHILVDANNLGDLALQLHTPRYLPANPDPRELGFVVSNLVITPTVAGLHVPAFGQLGWLLCALALMYAASRRVGLSVRETLLLALLCGGGLALLLIYQRLILTIFMPILVAVLGSSYGLAVVLTAIARRWSTDPACAFANDRSRLPLLWSPVPLIVLAFALRIGGLFHPHTLINDIGLHANNILGLSLGNVFFTEDLPSDAGGGPSPYPPGMYLLLMPLQLLTQPNMAHRIQLLNIGVSLLDSLVVGLIWLMLWRGGFGRRAAWFGAALYIAPPPLLASFSIGEAANIGGQVLALPALTLLALATPQPLPWRDSLRWLLPALCVALLAHMGVSISLVCLLAALWIQVAVSKRWRPQLGRLTAIGLLAACVAATVYYSMPLFVEIFAARASASGGAPAPSAGTPGWLRVVERAWTLFTPGHRITPLLTVAGLTGVFLVGAHQRRSALPLLLNAWWLGTLLSLLLLLIAQQGVREQHFLYPALCLGAGPLLAALWRRGQAGRIAALIGLLVPIVFGALFWVAQLIDYLH